MAAPNRGYGVTGGDWTSAGESQDHGYGIAPSGGFQPFQTSTGLQSTPFDTVQRQPSAGVPGGGGYTVAPMGFDQRSPGVAEQYQQVNQGRTQTGGYGQVLLNQNAMSAYGQPGQAEQYWAGVQGDQNRPSATADFAGGNASRVAGPSRTSNAYDAYSQRPASLDAHYDRAIGQAQQDTQRANAAQGRAGSAYAANQSGDIAAQMRADQAREGAQFDLNAAMARSNMAGASDAADLARFGAGQGLANQMDYQTMARLGLFGNLAQNAQGLGLQRSGHGVQDAIAVDQLDLQRYQTGLQAALAAQGMQGNRAQGYADNLFRQQNALMPLTLGVYQNQIQGDQDLMNAALAGELQQSETALGQSYRDQERQKADADFGSEHVKNVFGLVGGGGGG